MRRAFALTILFAYLSSLSPAFCLDSKKLFPPTARTSSFTESPDSAGRFSLVFFHYIHISVRVSGRQYQNISYSSDSFDAIGNMTRKTSGSSVYPQKAIGSYLDYDFEYGYAAGFAHRLDHAAVGTTATTLTAT